jgi:hypothetical protein
VNKDSNSLVTPLTRRIFNALPGSTVAIGAGFAVVMLVLFFTGRELLDGAAGSTAGDLRLAIIHILLTAHAAFAYAFLLMASRRAAHELAPVVEHAPEWQAIVDRVGMHRPLGLAMSALFGILLYLYATEITTTDAEPWVWAQTNYDSRWMRVIGPLFAMWTSCFLYVLVVESARMSRLSESIRSLDLLDLQPYQPRHPQLALRQPHPDPFRLVPADSTGLHVRWCVCGAGAGVVCFLSRSGEYGSTSWLLPVCRDDLN